MAPNYCDFAPKKDIDVKLTVSTGSSMFYKFRVSRHSKSFRQRRTIAHDRLFRVAFVLLSHCCELRNLQRKKTLKKNSHRPAREREGGVSLPWVPDVKTGEFASPECENRAHRLFSNNMRRVCNALT